MVSQVQFQRCLELDKLGWVSFVDPNHNPLLIPGKILMKKNNEIIEILPDGTFVKVENK